MLPKTEISARNTVLSVKELILGLIVASIWWPICITLYILNMTLRTTVQSAYDYFYGPGRFLVTNGEDGVFGYKLKGNCNSLIQGFQIIKGKPNLAIIREKFLSLLESEETSKDYSRFKSTFTHKWGYYCWAQDLKFDIRKHIKVLENWDITKEADDRRLMDLIADFVKAGMTSDRPQWEILLVPKYRSEETSKSEEQYALITRFNHAYSDAISYFLMVNNYIADSKSELPMDPTTPFKVPLWAKLILWAKVILLGPYYFVATMIIYTLDKSVFSTPYYSDSKMYARSPKIKLETIKQIKQISGTNVTAVLHAALYSALYKCHRRLHEDVEVPLELHLGSVMAMWPYWKERKLGNQFTLWPYAAPFRPSGDENDLKERLRDSHEVTLRGIGSPGPVFNYHLTKALGSSPKLFHPLLWQLNGCPLMLSNVPGFSTPLKIYGGEMVDAAGWIPLMTTVGIGLSTQTYCGDLRFNCVVDPKAFQKRTDLQDFLDDIINELNELARIYKVSEADISVIPVKTLDTLEIDARNNDTENDEKVELDENGNLINSEDDKSVVLRRRSDLIMGNKAVEDLNKNTRIIIQSL